MRGGATYLRAGVLTPTMSISPSGCPPTSAHVQNAGIRGNSVRAPFRRRTPFPLHPVRWLQLATAYEELTAEHPIRSAHRFIRGYRRYLLSRFSRLWDRVLSRI